MNNTENKTGNNGKVKNIIYRLAAILITIVIVAVAALMIRTVTMKPGDVSNEKKQAMNLVTATPHPLVEGQEDESEVQVEETLSPEEIAENKAVEDGLAKANPSLVSKYATVMSEDGTVLYGKKETSKMYPASMTKLMTALLVVENVSDLSEKVTVSQETMNYTYDEDGSTAGFVAGERASVLDMLYGVLLPSGAECSVTLGEYVAGTHKDFVTMMNDKAKELGMKNTHFANCVGFYNKGNYSTAEDIAILLRECLQDDQLKEIMSQSSHKVKKTNKHKKGFTFYSTVFKKVKKIDLSGMTFLGGKTGYTNESGQCLATAAEINGRVYIVVTGASFQVPNGIAGSAADAQTLYRAVKKITK